MDRHGKTVSGMRRKNGEAERGIPSKKRKKYPRYARYIQRKRNRSIDIQFREISERRRRRSITRGGEKKKKRKKR